MKGVTKAAKSLQSCLTLCDPMDLSTPGFPVHHQLPELSQTLIHQVSDAIQTSHPLSSPSLPVFNISFHFMAAVTICSDFGAPQNKVCHGFHWFPLK